MANRARGETVINVPDVGEVTLCLTMAGMAALELLSQRIGWSVF